MAVAITHSTVATGVDDPASQISKDEWNAGHSLSGLNAAAVPFTPTGTIAATDVQAAIAEVASEGFANPMTTAADLIVGGASGVPARLAKGADGQVLTVDPTTHLLVWATSSSGFSNPMTTKGDIIVGDTGGAPIRKAVAADGQVLTADAASTGGIKWAAGGGSSGSPFGLDTRALNGTYGDAFAGASLDGKWTRHVQGSGEETYQAGASASALMVAYSTGAAARYIYQTAPNGTNETWETCVSWYQETTTNQMFALLMVDTSGNGVAALVYDNARAIYLANVATHLYTSVLTNNTNLFDPIGYHEHGGRIWLRLRKATGLYAASFSYDGETYSREVTGTPTAFTPARVGIGRILGTNANDIGYWHWFDKTA